MSAFVVGLDLGQAADYSALVIAERTEAIDYDPAMVRTVTHELITAPVVGPMGGVFAPARRITESRRMLMHPDGSATDVPESGQARYDVRYIRRWKLGTAYPTIVEDVCNLMRTPPLARNAVLLADATGVGRPVIDMFHAHKERTFPLTAVLITGGDKVTRDAGFVHVPKRDLVSTVQVLLQSRRLRIAPSLPEAATLQTEMQNFQTKISLATAHDSYGAWREGQHDDLVLALALAVWHGERGNVRLRHL